MGGKKQKSKARLDKFYYLAKDHGFRSRAAFKLIQLNKKYRFLENSTCLIDLCAAPGGWLQVAAKYMPVSSIKIGIDLDPIKAIPGATTFQADITSEKCRFLIKKEIKHFKADVVLNDGAPNVGGTWTKDAYNQSELVLFALKLATEFLKEKGMFITKIFRSSDYNSLIYVLKQLFEKVDATKPAASRNESAEIFVVCQGYKAPTYIDPKLMDPKFALIQLENEEDMKLNSINSIKAMFDIKKSRGGYYTSSLYNEKTLKDFIECQNPYQFLYENNKIKISTDDCIKYKELCKCPDEVEILMSDLKVLGKKEMRDLIIWRQKIRSKAFKKEKIEKEGENVEEEANYEEVKLNEIDVEIETLEKEKKRKVAHDKRKKDKNDLKQKMSFISQNEGAADDGVDYDQDLFDYLRDQEIDIEDLPDKVQVKKKKKEKFSVPDEEIDLSNMSEDEYIDMMNKDIEDNMEMFDEERKQAATTRKITNKMNKKIKKQERMEQEAKEELEKSIKKEKDEDSDKDEQEKELDDSSDFLDYADGDNDDDGDDEEESDDDVFEDNPLRNLNNKNKNKMEKKTEEKNKETEEIVEVKEEDQLSDDTDEEIDKSKKRKKLNENNDFQEEKVLSEEDDKEYDTDDKAEIRAIAKKMLRKKNRLNIFFKSYGRYAFDDHDAAPKWFVDEENQHNKPMKPVTKEEIMREKEELREVNSKMPKKVLEAKNRKKRKIARQMQKVKKKAESIVNQEEINERSKVQQIEKLYKKELSKFKEKKKYVVSKKYKQNSSSQRKGGKNVKFVDGRMRKEVRAQKRRDKSKKGKKGGKRRN